MYKQLIPKQRYIISTLLEEGRSKKYIAQKLGVSPSIITRELQRNSNKNGTYNAKRVNQEAEERSHRTPGNRAIHPKVWAIVKNLLIHKQWSPEQISGYLAKVEIKISYETIYSMIQNDKINRGVLYTYLRHKLKRRKRCVSAADNHRIKDRVNIQERPKEADGTRFGDFEMDTILGKNQQQTILTLVERETNTMFMKKLPYGKNAKELALEVVRIFSPYKHIIKTITTDNGTEFAYHKLITKRLGVQVYFTDPYASWQKGTIENINELIRQYLPKGSSFKNVDDIHIQQIQDKINMRPRKNLILSHHTICFRNFVRKIALAS